MARIKQPRPRGTDYTYRDPYLSMWQSAAQQVAQRRASTKVAGFATSAEQESSLGALTNPIHEVYRQGSTFWQKVHDFIFGTDLPDTVNVAADCAKVAAKFLWAEITRNKANSDRYASELQKSTCDLGGWSECVTTYLEFKAKGGNFPYRDHLDPVFSMADKVQILILGDWGTGEDDAIALLKEAKAKATGSASILLVHLGDIYYSGTQDEANANFLQICRDVLGPASACPLYSLCGNHDMYSGGNGYYWLVDQIGQQGSYFCLRNESWQLLSMDTGHNDCNPFTVATNMTSLNGTEVGWHLSKIQNPQGRRTILLSHHQLFSSFASVGRFEKHDYAYNRYLFANFQNVIPKIAAWFWGHEHNLAIYNPYMGLERGRCVGCSAIPVFTNQQWYTVDTSLATLQPGVYPSWNTAAQLGNNGDDYNHAFAILTLDGPSAHVDYYQMPIGGSASSLYSETL